MEVIIGGDLVPTNSNIELFKNGNIDALIGKELYSLWNSTDIRIFNLETPLVDEETPIKKCGPNLIAPTDTINGINKLEPSLLTIANNHILDQGIEGLKSTENILKQNKIPFIGAGNNLNEARKSYTIEKNGFKIGVYACAENEFSIATDKKPGANPFDPLESLDHIKELNDKCDYLIVLYHGGKEQYRYPSPLLQKTSRKIIEKGANLIVCQHSHCIGCYEEYKGSTIVYGQGNFIFNKYDNEYWNTSLLIKLKFSNIIEIEYIPILKNGKGVSLAIGKDKECILQSFKIRSQEILQEDFIEENYTTFADQKIGLYLNSLSGMGKWISRLDRKIFNGILLKKIYNEKKMLQIQNYFECEAHRELILKGLKRGK
ncbi:MAG: CapA family protein [Senegalia sp. (in: firmicutes)]|uniref:CapA family protein n=1 Tax=Senegalia sp. (in: firmicutes) TaxID=1924098 RepID=UPI003F9C2769